MRCRLVAGIRDRKLSAKLQLVAVLNLQKAMEAARKLKTPVNSRPTATKMAKPAAVSTMFAKGKLKLWTFLATEMRNAAVDRRQIMVKSTLLQPRGAAKNSNKIDYGVDEPAIPDSPVRFDMNSGKVATRMYTSLRLAVRKKLFHVIV